MDYKHLRKAIKECTNSPEPNIRILNSAYIDVTKDGFCRVRQEDKTPSCKINKDGSFHDFGSGEHYTDIVSLLFDGYHAFDSLTDTMQWVCDELNITWEVADE